MLFNSYEFILVFLPVCIAGSFALARSNHPNYIVPWLTVCSALFYAWWNPRDLFVLIPSIVTNFVIGKRLADRPNKRLLALGVGLNLMLLGYFKYSSFIASSIGFENATLENLSLPLGISFFTFQQIAFLVDANGRDKPNCSAGSYALFVSFFPQLIAGPIVHHKQLIPQFDSTRLAGRNSQRDVAIGLSIFAIGLFKKAVLADRIAPYVQVAFDGIESGGDPSILMAWQAVLGYGMQLYFDFSGYCDMALGAARMLGVRLPINFMSPYKSRNISQFWRRWHITLSEFLRDYLYFPLGGSRSGTWRTLRNLMITMALGGLWHGAGWNFVIWGILHGGFLCVSHGWGVARDKFFSGSSSSESRTYKLASSGLTFLSVTMAWAFFRAETTPAAFRLVSGLFGLNGIDVPAAIHRKAADSGIDLQSIGIAASSDGGTTFIAFSAWIMVLLAIVWCLPNTADLMGLSRSGENDDAADSREQKFSRRLTWSPDRRWAIIIGLMFAIGVLSLPEVSVFLYFQF